MVTKSHDLSLKSQSTRGADLTDITEGNIGADGFNDEARYLNDLPHANNWDGGLDTAPQVLHERWKNGRLHIITSESGRHFGVS